MVVKYQGAVSSPQPLFGGTVQGSLIGIILFIVELSDAGMPVPQQTSTNDVISLPFPTPTATENEIRLKYIDDQSQGEVVNLETALDLHSKQNGPRVYHDRHGHILPQQHSLLQRRLNDINEYTKIHKLKINEEKPKIMSIKFDFQPKLFIGAKQLEVVSSTKLLGVMFSSNLKLALKTKIILQPLIKW